MPMLNWMGREKAAKATKDVVSTWLNMMYPSLKLLREFMREGWQPKKLARREEMDDKYKNPDNDVESWKSGVFSTVQMSPPRPSSNKLGSSATHGGEASCRAVDGGAGLAYRERTGMALFLATTEQGWS